MIIWTVFTWLCFIYTDEKRRHSSMDSSVPSILQHRVWILSTPSTLLSSQICAIFFFVLWKEQTQTKKRPGLAQYFWNNLYFSEQAHWLKTALPRQLNFCARTSLIIGIHRIYLGVVSKIIWMGHYRHLFRSFQDIFPNKTCRLQRDSNLE